MRHRITSGFSTGLGNPSKEILTNKGDITFAVKRMLLEATNLYFKKWGGCDYDIEENKIKFGIEPAYQFENLKIIVLNRKKETSFMQTGIAWGTYGSGIASKYRFYSNYKRNGKFKKFIDRWHSKVFK